MCSKILRTFLSPYFSSPEPQQNHHLCPICGKRPKRDLSPQTTQEIYGCTKEQPLAPNFHFCVLYINHTKPQVSNPSNNTNIIYLHRCKTIPICLCISLQDTHTQESSKPSIPFLSLPPEVVNVTSYGQRT